jgi:hypothetical protein
MTTRSDATPLSIGDRYYLMESAVNMIEEGLESIHTEALQVGVEPDDLHLIESLEEMRLVAYASLLQTMANDTIEAKELVLLMRQNSNNTNS